MQFFVQVKQQLKTHSSGKACKFDIAYINARITEYVEPRTTEKLQFSNLFCPNKAEDNSVPLDLDAIIVIKAHRQAN